jgi:hypothetical protein
VTTVLDVLDPKTRVTLTTDAAPAFFLEVLRECGSSQLAIDELHRAETASTWFTEIEPEQDTMTGEELLGTYQLFDNHFIDTSDSEATAVVYNDYWSEMPKRRFRTWLRRKLRAWTVRPRVVHNRGD